MNQILTAETGGIERATMGSTTHWRPRPPAPPQRVRAWTLVAQTLNVNDSSCPFLASDEPTKVTTQQVQVVGLTTRSNVGATPDALF